MRLFDTHVHMDDPRYDPDRDALLLGLAAQGVELIVNPSANMEESRAAVALSEKYPFVYAAVGVHPSETAGFSEADCAELLRLAAKPKTVAIGEIGLDYHYDDTDKETQKRAFARQLELVKEAELPVIIHSRDACADTLELVRASGVRRGVVHCFGGSAETAREYVDMGFHVSFTGVLTFKNAHRVREACAAVPLERLMIETDGPYMSPEPHRGERNEPGFVRFVAAKMAEIKGVSPDQLAEITFNNALKFFGIEEPA